MWCEMMIELEPSFWNRPRRRNDKSARGHETTHDQIRNQLRNTTYFRTFSQLNSLKKNIMQEVYKI